MIRTSEQFQDEAGSLLGSELFQEALNVTRQGLKQFPGDAGLRVLEAVSLEELGHYPMARDILEELLVKEPSDLLILTELTEVYLSLGRKKDAIRCAREALRQDYCDDECALMFAEQFNQHGVFAEAARCSALAVKMNPMSAEAWFRLGDAVVLLEHEKAAEFCCRRAIKISPDLWDARLLLGHICFNSDSDRDKEAKELWESIPLKNHDNSMLLAAWRVLLRFDDPRVKDIRRRWSELRAEARLISPYPGSGAD